METSRNIAILGVGAFAVGSVVCFLKLFSNLGRGLEHLDDTLLRSHHDINNMASQLRTIAANSAPQNYQANLNIQPQLSTKAVYEVAIRSVVENGNKDLARALTLDWNTHNADDVFEL